MGHERNRGAGGCRGDSEDFSVACRGRQGKEEDDIGRVGFFLKGGTDRRKRNGGEGGSENRERKGAGVFPVFE